MILVQIILSSYLTHVHGWGSDGHEAITSLARKLMTSRNADSLLEPLGDLNKASKWADSDEAEEKYPLSGAYHFSNTPYRNCQAFDMNRDCGFGRTKGLCIVTGLSEAVSLAIDPLTSDTDRADSLKFILHLMADIHQPLHTGFREDTGGLRVILGQPKDVDLHAIWDTTMIDQLRNSSGSVDIQHLQSLLDARNGAFVQRICAQTNLTRVVESQALITEYIAAIATDTATTATCRSAYMLSDKEWIGVGDAITPEYLASRVPSVTVQVLKASVRLALLLDTIADTLYMRRKSLKAARRSERIAKLFEPKPVDVGDTVDRLESNQFTALFIDFESILDDSTPLEIRSVRRVSPKRESDDDAVFEEYTKAAAIERASYTFYGIDLSELVFFKSRGVAIISSKSNVQVRDYHPKLMDYCPVDYINKSGKKSVVEFGFDSSVFTKKMNDELVIRAILAVSGIDPRIDITDYLAIYTPIWEARRDVTSPILRALWRAHGDRDTNTSNFPARLERMKGKIAFVKYDSPQMYVYFHVDSFVDGRGSNFHRRFIRHRTFQGDGKKTPRTMWTVYVDPAIADGPLESEASGTKYFGLLFGFPHKARKLPKNLSFLNELQEIETAIRQREMGTVVPFHLAGKHVEYFFDYPGEKRGGYFVVELFQKGATERQIIDSLKLTLVHDYVYTDEYSVAPHGYSESDIELIRKQTDLYFAMGAKNAHFGERQVNVVLHRIEKGLEQIMAFQVGNLKAFFYNTTVANVGLKFVVSSVDEHQLAQPLIYLIDTKLLHHLQLPLSMMAPIISKLDYIGEERWQTSHPSRPDLIAQLTAIQYLLTSNETDEVKFSSPQSAPIQSIGDFKSTGPGYGLLIWD